MKIIADCGGSKTDWRIIGISDSIEQKVSSGFNPHVNPVLTFTEIVLHPISSDIASNIKEVYFYGAGISIPKFRSGIKSQLESHFPNARVDLNHDLLGAARALCQREKGIVNILGTGANSCLYDGIEIVESVNSLGYLLGDEGSGAWIGKQLSAAYIRNELPVELHKAFKKRVQADPKEFRASLYETAKPNEFLGAFAKFAFDHQKDEWVYQLISEGFRAFIDHNISRYSGYKEQPVHFSGGIAFYMNNILRQVCYDYGLTVGKIIESPIAGLTLYHSQE